MAKAVKKVKVETPTKMLVSSLLKQIAEATTAGAFVYVSKEDAEQLVEAGYIILNHSLVEPETGNIAARTTEAGTQLAATTASEVTKEPEPIIENKIEEKQEHNTMSHEFEIETVDIVRTRAPRNGARVWPFDRLEQGQSFHIAPTEKVPEPYKVYTSTISNANKAHAPKHFSIIRVTATDPKGPGARVIRQADFTPDQLAERAAASAKRAAASAAKKASE
jgi:hypothetical protein